MAPRADIVERLFAAAGYADSRERPLPAGGRYADEFALILHALEYIGNRKVDEYGDSRLAVESVDYDTKMLYSDLYRKHIRVNELMESIRQQVWRDKTIEPDKLIETFGDLAVYAVRGIQILLRLEEKGLLHHERVSHRSNERTGSGDHADPARTRMDRGRHDASTRGHGRPHPAVGRETRPEGD